MYYLTTTYKGMFANAKSGYDYAAFIEKYASNDPDNLIPRAKAAEYQKLYEEAYSSSDCSRFMEKYANNDPNGYIPKVQEKRAVALEREEQARLAEARRQEEKRKEREKITTREWTYSILSGDVNSYSGVGVTFRGTDADGTRTEPIFANLTIKRTEGKIDLFLYDGNQSRGSVAINLYVSGSKWTIQYVSHKEFFSSVWNLCNNDNVNNQSLASVAIEMYIQGILKKN